jgi:hypothetical protein
MKTLAYVSCAAIFLFPACAEKIVPSVPYLSASHWGNPAFGGTINQIKSLEEAHASLAAWKKEADNNETITSKAHLERVLGSDRPQFTIFQQEALDFWQRSSSVHIFRFPGLYFALVFFDQSKRSFCVARHLPP